MLPSVFLLSTVLAGWGPAGCAGAGPVGPWVLPMAAPNRPSWEGWYPTEHGSWAEYRDGRQVGLWEAGPRQYTPYDETRDEWGPSVVLDRDPRELSASEVRRLVREATERGDRAAAPGRAKSPCLSNPRSRTRESSAKAPGLDDFGYRDPRGCGGTCQPCCCGTAGATAVQANYGVELDKIVHGQERYGLNGRPVGAHEARQAVTGDGAIPDDRNKLRLTVIGDEAQRRQVCHDLASAPELADFRGRYAVQDYPPDHWAVARAGFATDGRPTIYVQDAGGKVLHRQDDYRGPADLAGALRRADPGYDRRRDPDLRKLGLPFLLDLSEIPAPAWLLAAGGLLLVFLRKGKP